MPDQPSALARAEILLLEDDPLQRKRLQAHLQAEGAEVSVATRLDEARRLAREIRFDYAALDLQLPDGEALALLREQVFSENAVVVVMTAFGGVKKAVEAMRLGARDYLAKPFEAEELTLALLRGRREQSAQRREQHQRAAPGRAGDELFFGEGLATVRRQLDQVLAADRRVQGRPPPVLIEGETGTGKSALARWLHAQGPRAAAPFVTLNCAALPETLLESELFGHERGAFTDAKQARLGLFEAAEGGTLFLDEIGALPASAQAKLLLAVETGCIRRLGGTKELGTDVRIIAAGNRPLRQLVAEGRFREDLYHRLNLLHVALPPLRERAADLPALARHLLGPLATRHGYRGLGITAAGIARLCAQPWPGNLRDLAHELERAVIFSEGEPLAFAHLAGPATPPGTPPPSWRNPAWRLPESGFALDDVTAALIQEALRETGGNVSAAARRLGVTRDFLRYRLAGQGEGNTESSS